MAELRTLKLLFLLFFAFSAYGQKVKYKDIYSLLSTKQYDAAEPFLKRYLASEQDNPNAFLYMGIIYQEKAVAQHVLRDTRSLVAYADSAIRCFDRAASMLTEREVKRNAEFYQAYNRRDLRTGEFGIALSDITFDLQKRKEALLTRTSAAKMLRHHFESADSLYAACVESFQALKKQHLTQKDLFLRADESTVKTLDEVLSRFDAAIKAIRLYQSSMKSPGVPAYRHDFNLHSIKNYATEGSDAVDFLSEEVNIWDFGAFTADVRGKIISDILPLQKETSDLLRRLSSTDSNVVFATLPYKRFKPYGDTNPLPLQLAQLCVADNMFQSKRAQTAAFADSLDVHIQLELAQSEARALEQLDSALNLLRQQNLTTATHQYAHFLPEELRSAEAVEALIRTISSAANDERQRIKENLAMRELQARRLRIGDELIPLSAADTLDGCRPLITKDELYTVGVKRMDSVNVAGYFYSITPSRVPDIAATFALDATVFGPTRWTSVKALSTDANGLVYYVLIYSDQPEKEKYPARVAKIYRADGLSWTADLQLAFVPEALEYQANTGMLAVRGQETLLIDKNGKPQ
jgi:hypothetical protein